MGKRLYRVVATWRENRSHHIIASTAPRPAADLYLQSIGEARADTSASGFALDVGQPAEWFDQEPAIMPYNCKHDRATFIESSHGQTSRHHVIICPDCGQIEVFVAKNGQCSTIEFGLNCDEHIRWAAKYLRSPLQEAEAVRRATL